MSVARAVRMIAAKNRLSSLDVPILDDAADLLEKYEAALKAIAGDDAVWSDGDGLREDGSPAFERVQSIAKKALAP